MFEMLAHEQVCLASVWSLLKLKCMNCSIILSIHKNNNAIIIGFTKTLSYFILGL